MRNITLAAHPQRAILDKIFNYSNLKKVTSLSEIFSTLTSNYVNTLGNQDTVIFVLIYRLEPNFRCLNLKIVKCVSKSTVRSLSEVKYSS